MKRTAGKRTIGQVPPAPPGKHGLPPAAMRRKPLVAVDVALFSAFEGALHVLLLKNAHFSETGKWALPGNLVRPEESLDEAAERALREEASVGDVFIEQLYTFGNPRRDVSDRVITVAYYALVNRARFSRALESGGDLVLARVAVPWEGETGGPVETLGPDAKTLDLAFGHGDIIGMAVKRLRGKLNYAPIGFQLLPQEFTLRELQEVHETILDRPLNKDSFRRKMLNSGELEATGKHESSADHRPAELYRFMKRTAL